MSRPLIRVLSAAWPGATEPRRARFLETLHRSISARYESEVLAPLVFETDSTSEERRGIAIERFPYPSRGGTVKSRGIGPLSALAYCLSAALTARALWGGRRWGERRRGESRRGLVLAHWIVPLGWIAAGVARRSKLPLVLYAHGSDVNVYARGRVGRRILRRAVRRATLIFAASEALADTLREVVADAPPIVVLPVGIEPDFRAGTAPPPFEGELRLLFVGDPIEAKGRAFLSRAVELSQERGLAVRLDWIGAARSAESPTVGTLRGDLDAAEVAEAMRQAHLLVLPSRNEGTPVVLQEAIASALPWAATPVGGIPALAERFPGGTLLPAPDDPEAVVEALVALFEAWLAEGEAGVRERWKSMVASETDELRVERRAEMFADRLDEVIRCAS